MAVSQSVTSGGGGGEEKIKKGNKEEGEHLPAALAHPEEAWN